MVWRNNNVVDSHPGRPAGQRHVKYINAQEYGASAVTAAGADNVIEEAVQLQPTKPIVPLLTFNRFDFDYYSGNKLYLHKSSPKIIAQLRRCLAFVEAVIQELAYSTANPLVEPVPLPNTLH